MLRFCGQASSKASARPAESLQKRCVLQLSSIYERRTGKKMDRDPSTVDTPHVYAANRRRDSPAVADDWSAAVELAKLFSP